MGPFGWVCTSICNGWVSSTCISLHSKTQKHDNSPFIGRILAIPTRQFLLLSIIDGGDMRGGGWGHRRRRTGAGRLRRSTCKFCRCCWRRWLSGRQYWMDGWDRHIGRCLWVLGRGCKRFGVDWLCIGREMRACIASAEGCRHGFDRPLKVTVARSVSHRLKIEQIRRRKGDSMRCTLTLTSPEIA